MIRLLSIIKEAELGQREVDPTTGVATVFKGQDPETGRMSWDVENPIDMELVHKKIKELIKYMKNAKEGSEEEKVKKILQYLSRDAAKLY